MLITLLLISLLGYSIFTYAFTDPNLVLFQASWYQYFQQNIWQVFFHNHQLTAMVFVSFLILFFGCYFLLLRAAKGRRKIPLFVFLLFIPLIFSYNALSHDVFNYAFNAKMVVVYGANPHEKAALHFAAFDDWVRFMHNTHTPAPYGYGWTMLSVIPYFISGGSFFLTWLGFKFFALLSMVLLYVSLQYYSQQKYARSLKPFEIILVFGNPLLYLEVLSNAHNDLWMMAPAIVSFALMHRLLTFKKSESYLIIVSLLLLLFSVTIKLATLLLLPFWLLLCSLYIREKTLLDLTLFAIKKVPAWMRNRSETAIYKILTFVTNWLLQHLEDLMAVTTGLLLITSRSQRFLPWYLIWLLVWFPFMKSVLVRLSVLTLSVSSMFRYLPWILEGGYGSQTHTQEIAITWIPLLVVVCSYLFIPSVRNQLRKWLP